MIAAPRAPHAQDAAPRLVFVEYLRGFAAVAVAWFHLTNGYGASWVQASGAFGWLGVEIFFVISGFIIPYALSRAPRPFSARAYGVFLMRRMVRLEPPYLASILLVLALWHLSALSSLYAGGGPDYTLAQVAAHLLYVVPLTDHQWLQPVYWTLAYEFVFYLAIGALFPWVCAARHGWWWAAAAAAVILGATADLWSARLLLFLFGVAAFRSRCAGASPAATAAAFAATGAALAAEGLALEAAVGAATGAALLFATDARLRAGLAHRALAGLGAISYSIYLLHIPIGGRVVNLGKRLAEGDAAHFALSAAALAVSIACAAVFWRLVERPAMAAARRIGRGSPADARRPAPEAPAARPGMLGGDR